PPRYAGTPPRPKGARGFGAAARTRARILPGPGSGRSMWPYSGASGPPCSRTNAARIWAMSRRWYGAAAMAREDIPSTKPLVDKLGVKEGQRVAVLGDDPAFVQQLLERGADVRVGRRRTGADLMVVGVEHR